MDQLRHLLYNPPKTPLRWSPFRPRAEAPVQVFHADTYSAPNTPDSAHSSPSSERSSSGLFSPTQKYIAAEIRYSPERGHPNICKLLDFFEDREFYYRESIYHFSERVLIADSGNAALWYRRRPV